MAANMSVRGTSKNGQGVKVGDTPGRNTRRAGRSKSQPLIQDTDRPDMAWNDSQVLRCAYHLTQLHPTRRHLATLRRLNYSRFSCKPCSGRTSGQLQASTRSRRPVGISSAGKVCGKYMVLIHALATDAALKAFHRPWL